MLSNKKNQLGRISSGMPFSWDSRLFPNLTDGDASPEVRLYGRLISTSVSPEPQSNYFLFVFVSNSRRTGNCVCLCLLPRSQDISADGANYIYMYSYRVIHYI